MISAITTPEMIVPQMLANGFMGSLPLPGPEAFPGRTASPADRTDSR